MYCRLGGEEDITDASGLGRTRSRASSLQYGRIFSERYFLLSKDRPHGGMSKMGRVW